ncbi:MAG: ABC transporter permease subunit [Actinomycetota bacterium]
MLRDIWTKTLWDQRRALLGWAVGLLAVSLIYGGFYPFAATPAYGDLIANLPEGLAEAMGWSDISSPHGYLGSTVFGILGPILTIIFAIATGARAIAGDEESGSLELLITHPVTRTRVVVHRAIALILAVLGAGAIVFGAILVISGPIELELPMSHVAAASLQLALLACVFGSLAMLVGGVVGRRGLVLGVSAIAAVLSYLANGVAPMVDALAWMQDISPFYWFAGTDTLRDGLDPANAALLAGLSALFLLGSVIAFNRRDVAV